MAARSHSIEDGVSKSSVSRRRTNVFTLDLSEEEKAILALENGIKVVHVLFYPTSPTDSFPPTLKLFVDLFDNCILDKDGDVFRSVRGGKFVLETKSISSVKNLCLIDHIGGVPVSYKVMEDSIVSKFIIRGMHSDIELSEIAAALTEAGIQFTEIVRFDTKGSDNPVPFVLVKEIGLTSRSEIKLWEFFMYDTSPYIESPKICLRCLKFGHRQKTCTGAYRCKRCGDNHQPKASCTKKPCCFHCKSKDHTADDPSCPKYKLEKAIINKASALKIPYAEAKELVEPEQSRPEKERGSQQPSGLSREEIAALRANLRDLVQKFESMLHELRNLMSNISEISRVSNEIEILRSRVTRLNAMQGA